MEIKPMRKALVLLFLGFALSSCGNANDSYDYDEPMRMMPQNPSWKTVTISTEKTSVLAVDDNSIKKDGQNAKAWVAALSFENGMENGKLEAHYYREFDCSNGQFRTLKTTTFSEENVPESELTETNWREAPAGSMNQHVLNYVCFGQLP